jgi:phage tail-like protein
MARSSEVDPIEKFRFRISVIAITPSLTGAIDTIAGGLIPTDSILGTVAKNTRVLMRAGFSNVVMPKMTITEMTYRENIDGNRFTKHPGLSRYEPVVLKRGVTKNRDLYDWLRLVNEELLLLASAQEMNKDTAKPTIQSENFRKDVVIEVLDREGNPIKGWYLFNAWPSAYKPGDDLDSSADTKLVEELTLTYEFFLELEGGLIGFAKELAKNAVNSYVVPTKLPFTR